MWDVGCKKYVTTHGHGLHNSQKIQIHNFHLYYNTPKYYRCNKYILVSSKWQIEDWVRQWLWGQRRLHLMWRGEEERLVV